MMTASQKLPRFRRVAPDQRRELLIAAGMACLAKGGILGFTIERICAEAQVSRGLITHHFGAKDNLLAAIYETMIGQLLSSVEGKSGGIGAIINSVFPDGPESRETLRIWLALWGEIANTPALLKAHRKQYTRYRAAVESALGELARQRKRQPDIRQAAIMFISLVDGLWLERSIDPRQISAEDARAACWRLLEPMFGPPLS